MESEELLHLTTEIVAAQVRNNNVATSDLPGVIASVHGALARLNTAAPPVEAPAVPMRTPAVPVKSSVKPDYLVCLEDGKKLKMLKRYLARQHGMTPDQYRARWGLPATYPMVAPNYSAQRRDLALSFGLGRTH